MNLSIFYGRCKFATTVRDKTLSGPLTAIAGLPELPIRESNPLRIHVKTDQARFVGHCGEGDEEQRPEVRGQGREAQGSKTMR